jgi:putative flippase GtrA
MRGRPRASAVDDAAGERVAGTTDADRADPPRGAGGRARRIAGQLARFLVVGGIAFAVDYGIFLLLHTWAGAPYVLASAVSLTTSLVVSYVLSVRFVFEARPGRNVLVELAAYVAISLVAIGINQLVLLASVELLALAPEVGKLVATAVVLVFNFVARKLLIERRPRGGRASRA